MTEHGVNGHAPRVRLTGEQTIGDVLTNFPAARPVIEKYFHGGCQSCPGQNTEPLWLAAKLYGLSLVHLLDEIMATIDGAGKAHAGQTDLSPRTPTERRLARDKARGLSY